MNDVVKPDTLEVDNCEDFAQVCPLVDGVHIVRQPVRLTGLWVSPLMVSIRCGGHIDLAGYFMSSVEIADDRDQA